MSNFWVSWYHCYETMGSFVLYTPWWVSGITMDVPEKEILCAAVKAEDEKHAMEIVLASYDKRPVNVEWRFCNVRESEWDPHSSRFQMCDWMYKYWERPEYRQEL